MDGYLNPRIHEYVQYVGILNIEYTDKLYSDKMVNS